MNQQKRYIIIGWWVALVGTTVSSLLPDMGPPTTPFFDIGLDKFIHLATYLVLAAVPALLFELGSPMVRSVVGVAVLSVAIELAQDLVPDRLFSMGDVLANLLGVILGVVIGLYSRRFAIRYFA